MVRTSARIMTLALVAGLMVATASPAGAMEIKKDDDCVDITSPSVEYNQGSPDVDRGHYQVNNCVTVQP